MFKRFNGLNIERLIDELSNIRRDFELLSSENQWLGVLIDGLSRNNPSPKDLYALFMNFTNYLPEFERLKSK